MELNQHVLVLGGARSGKSVFAEDLTLSLAANAAAEHKTKCIYIATAQIWDDEMQTRVATHQSRRTDIWQTVEAPLDLVPALLTHSRIDQPILVDCLTLWLTNLMMAEHDIDGAGNAMVYALAQLAGPVIFVSNEVGQGIVPDNKMARDFRDHAGSLHQKIAKSVSEVYFVTAGLPTKLKG